MMTKNMGMPSAWERAAQIFEKAVEAVEGGIVDYDIDDPHLMTLLDLDDSDVMDLIMQIETELGEFIPQDFINSCKITSARGWLGEINGLLCAKASLSFIHH